MSSDYQRMRASIRSARIREGYSQADVGRMLQPPRTHVAVSFLERGPTAISVDLLIQLARMLHQSACAWLQIAEEEA